MPQKHYKILAVNPGSTSTKIALYENETLLFEDKIDHPAQSLAGFARMADQLPMRREAVMSRLKERNVALSDLDAVSGRGGKLPPLRQGAYQVNAEMVDFLTNRPIDDHASNLGAMIGFGIAAPLGLPAFIYDAVVVDQLEDIARLSGVPEITRRASCHVLNMREVARKTAMEIGRPLEELNVVTCHMGGGITASILRNGRMIDVLTDEEGAYSPERAGGVPCRQLVNQCFSGEHTVLSATRRMRGQGGLVAYLGTNSALEVEKRIADGDERAERIYEGMAYQTAKGVAGLASVVAGNVDVIVLTGALAHSKVLVNWIVERVRFIAPVRVWPGEDELEALALGALRVLRGEEPAHAFVESELPQIAPTLTVQKNDEPGVSAA